jgi:DNA repair exonuclease SbcCD ATPase subunit
MRVTLLRDTAAEKRAKERAEAPTVKTEEQTRADEAAKEKIAARDRAARHEASQSIWKRKFRPLPETKAVDLFADVIGDSFILLVATGLILYEYIRSKGKPDANAEKIAELDERLKELDRREKELEDAEKQNQTRVETMEQALEEMRKATGKKKKKLLLS